MADNFSLPSVQVHSRSISLPARLRPANSFHIEAELNKLRTCEESCGSSESIRNGLIRLADLYNGIEDLVNSPCTQQALHKQQHVKSVEEDLDRSVGLLDACGNARELILNVKEKVQELQSALRRRVGGDYSSMESKIHAYISYRKKSKKEIAKCFRELKRIDSNIDQDHQELFVVNKSLAESSAITISIFRSILLFLSMSAAMTTKGSGWSFIRKLMAARSDQTSQEIFNEVGSVDIALHSLQGQIRKSDDAKIDVQVALRRLKSLDVAIRGLETGLDCLFRRLIQHRVSLLNVLTP